LSLVAAAESRLGEQRVRHRFVDPFDLYSSAQPARSPPSCSTADPGLEIEIEPQLMRVSELN
jgi:hypothetical protein